jgi:ABC-type multidrug transport system ATPase subunit
MLEEAGPARSNLERARVPTDDPVIATDRLTKRYRDRIVAVDGVSMSVRRGEVYGFLGPNGAGKTTTLRMLLGLVRPTAGTVRVLGAAPGDPSALARIGALVESPGLYPYLSGWDNLRVLARYAGVPAARVNAVLEVVDLTERAGDRFGTYSLGMKQRLGVAAALLKDPELLILDEPTNGLDPSGMADMRTLIRGLAGGRRSVLLSSHLLGEVQQICDRVGVISRGRLLREGTVEELRGRGSLLVAAAPSGAARALAERLLGPERVAVRDGSLRLDVEPDDAARINRELVMAGIAVRALSRAERSLEEIFFEMTSAERPEIRGAGGTA